MKNHKFGFAALPLVIIVLALFGIGAYVYTRPATPTISTPTVPTPPHPVACTKEAKICPDGSAVGRTGPKCEFAACPTVAAPVSGPITVRLFDINGSLLNKSYKIAFSAEVPDFRGYGERYKPYLTYLTDNRGTLVLESFPVGEYQVSVLDTPEPPDPVVITVTAGEAKTIDFRTIHSQVSAN